LLSVLVYFATVEALSGRTEITGFSVTGRITHVARNLGRIAVLCDAPHWGIGGTGAGPGFNVIVFLPANAELILKVAAIAPMTIDGKKIGFDQLAVGQRISVQYSIMVKYGLLDCAVRRIEGWTAAPTKTHRNVAK
jgi:hypothetical protein